MSTGVLERARRGGHRPQPGESHLAFYRRVEALGGEVPDLKTCWGEQEWTAIPLGPGDRLFPAMATCLIYQPHLGGRLFHAA